MRRPVGVRMQFLDDPRGGERLWRLLSGNNRPLAMGRGGSRAPRDELAAVRRLVREAEPKLRRDPDGKWRWEMDYVSTVLRWMQAYSQSTATLPDGDGVIPPASDDDGNVKHGGDPEQEIIPTPGLTPTPTPTSTLVVPTPTPTQAPGTTRPTVTPPGMVLTTPTPSTKPPWLPPTTPQPPTQKPTPTLNPDTPTPTVTPTPDPETPTPTPTPDPETPTPTLTPDPETPTPSDNPSTDTPETQPPASQETTP